MTALSMMFHGLAAMNTQANLLFAVFGLMIGILLLSGVISRIVLRKLSVKRDLPKQRVVGEPMTLFYKITNQKRFWPSVSVALSNWTGREELRGQPQMLHAACGAEDDRYRSRRIESGNRRGLHELDHFQLVTSFPFGFVKRAIDQRHKDEVCIFPPLAGSGSNA